jgi:23S rRNA (guanine2445-N2)-methyltransferase / 23S rRNA (guanine2069-N7)-methyltransferase
VLGVAPAAVVLKRRERQRGQRQYQRRSQRAEFLAVSEGSARLLVNLHDYLDTGLFLDHRPLRRRLGEEAAGRDFLNLFCYTGSATVHAALGGARSTTSVDLSSTYLDWLRRNLALNGLAEFRHRTERADVGSWLRAGDALYDLILLDPPSFSNSKKTTTTFDVQRDHLELLELCMRRLRPGGVLYFSNNRRRFRLDPEVSARYHCEDISAQTLDPDFARNPQIHCCYRLCHREPV